MTAELTPDWQLTLEPMDGMPGTYLRYQLGSVGGFQMPLPDAAAGSIGQDLRMSLMWGLIKTDPESVQSYARHVFLDWIDRHKGDESG